MDINFNKGISPIIGVILVLSITVIISVSLFSFLQNYIESSGESLDSNSFSTVNVVGVYLNKLYLDSNSNELMSFFQIKDLNGDVVCEVRDSKENLFEAETILLMSFESETINSTHLKDYSGFENHANYSGNISCDNQGIRGKSCLFNSSNLIQIPDNLYVIDNSTKLSIGFWLNPTNDTLINYLKNSNAKVSNSWNHIVYVYDGKTQEKKLYINGILDEKNLVVAFDFFLTMNVGTVLNNFDGLFDELVIFSNLLNPEEVSNLYEIKQAKFYEQLLSSKTKEINVSNCNLNINQKYTFNAVLDSGTKISDEFTVK